MSSIFRAFYTGDESLLSQNNSTSKRAGAGERGKGKKRSEKETQGVAFSASASHLYTLHVPS